jgi:hypothetical protein
VDGRPTIVQKSGWLPITHLRMRVEYAIAIVSKRVSARVMMVNRIVPFPKMDAMMNRHGHRPVRHRIVICA